MSSFTPPLQDVPLPEHAASKRATFAYAQASWEFLVSSLLPSISCFGEISVGEVDKRLTLTHKELIDGLVEPLSRVRGSQEVSFDLEADTGTLSNVQEVMISKLDTTSRQLHSSCHSRLQVSLLG